MVADAAGGGDVDAEVAVADALRLDRPDRRFDAGGVEGGGEVALDRGGGREMARPVRPEVGLLRPHEVRVVALEARGHQRPHHLRKAHRLFVGTGGAGLRHRHGRRLRIATKYWRLTQQFFSGKHGIQVYRIVESLGATEGAPAAGSADVIVDITTTGSTLRANHLKILSDGVILRSQACLVASRKDRPASDAAIVAELAAALRA